MGRDRDSGGAELSAGRCRWFLLLCGSVRFTRREDCFESRASFREAGLTNRTTFVPLLRDSGRLLSVGPFRPDFLPLTLPGQMGRSE
ncbi:hypothetical protein AAMO2058_000222200 [Amorphochlora amoebiformis]